jgi:hypothetical protein
VLSAYLDTCLVSGLAKEDLRADEAQALLEVLKLQRSGRIQVVTSDVTAKEIERIPREHRIRHEVIYNLLAALPMASRHSTNSGLMLMGVGGGSREHPIAAALKRILPDEPDVDHLYQASRNNVQYFVTVDDRTIRRYAKEVKAACGVEVVFPSELLLALKNTGDV